MTAAQELIARGKQEIGRGIYVWGGKGETVSALTDEKRRAFFEKRETADQDHTKEQNVARCEALYQKRRKAGVDPIRAYDCSGFLYALLHEMGLLSERYSSRSFYGACRQSTDRTGMGRNDLEPADLVFHHDGTKIAHVALYIGDGKVLESGGRDVGIQVRRLGAKDNRFGRLACLCETADEPLSPKTESGTVRVRYGTVNIRKGAGKTSERLKTARGGQTFPLLSVDSETGWYRIDLGGGKSGYISNRADLTEVVYGKQ